MIIRKAEYLTTAVSSTQYPPDDRPEIAFVGRSNVGKSSLINSMLNRRGLARISSSPGKTRTINFYNINDRLFFVDLPGYGYAKVSKVEKQKWGGIIEEYLLLRKNLIDVVLLVDIRHDPTPRAFSPADLLVYNQNIPNRLIKEKSPFLPHMRTIL
jgi:GTP-binding protein